MEVFGILINTWSLIANIIIPLSLYIIYADCQLPPTLPFLLKPGQLNESIQRCKEMSLLGLIPSELMYMPLEAIFTHPGWLKMHDKVILSGPVIKYLLQDFFMGEERKKLFL